MITDSADLAQRTAFREVTLQKLKMGAAIKLDPAIVHDLRLTEYMDEYRDRLIWQLRGYVWAESPKRISVSYPADWWQHFKLRWFPKRALKRWPVRYETKTMEGQIFYPCLSQTVPENVSRLRMAVYDGNSSVGDYQ